MSRKQGTIEAGRIADLLILTGDPLVDPRNLGRIDRVVKGGVVFDPSELLRTSR